MYTFLRNSAGVNINADSETIMSTQSKSGVERWSHMAKFYTVRKGPNQAEGDYTAICEQCIHGTKTYTISAKSVSSVDRHYRKQHLGLFNQYNNQKKKRKFPDGGHECSDIEPKKKKQTTIPIYTAMPQRVDNKTRENGIITYFIDKMVPFSHIDSTSFRNMILSFDSSFQVISRHTLRNKISTKYDITRKDLFDELQNAIAIGTTADSWIKGNR